MNKHLPATILFLLLVTSVSLLGESELVTGVEGVIVVSPAHAGPTMVDVPDTAPLANVDFDVRKGDKVVGSFKTDDLGRFQISLAPGHYVVSVKDGKHKIRSGPFEVDVIAGQVKHVKWTCDTGMR